MASADPVSVSPPLDPLSTPSADILPHHHHHHHHHHSLASPVTPAALSESINGAPSMRWKSYTASKLREPSPSPSPSSSSGCTGDNSRSVVAAPHLHAAPPQDVVNPKGKLVINLCRPPWSVAKQPSSLAAAAASSPSSLKMKRALEEEEELGDGVKLMSCEASTSEAQGAQLLHRRGENAPMDTESLNEAQDHEPGQEVPKIKSFSPNNVQISGLTRKVCRRIERIRRLISKPEKPCDRSAQDMDMAIHSEPKRKKKKREHGSQTTARLKSDMSTEINQSIPNSEAGERSEDVEDLMQDKCDASKDTKDSIFAKDQSEQYDNANDKFDTASDTYQELGNGISKEMNDTHDLSDGTILKEMKEDDLVSKDVVIKSFSRVRRNARSDGGGGFSETSKLDMKEQTVLETLLRDEPAGYSSAGGSERSRSYKSGSKAMKAETSFRSEEDCDDGESADAESERKGEAEGNQSDVCTSPSREYDGEEECDGDGLDGSKQTENGRRAYFSDQVIPSVLCDAEGNVWHIGKRAEQARGARKPKDPLSVGEKKPCGSNKRKQESIEVLKHEDLRLQPALPSLSSSVAPFNHLIETNWKWPSEADYTINPIGDVCSRSMVAKERSVFVGCIPDGTENLEAVLQNLMGEFLERFDFAPAILGQIQLVKIGKDYAFLELATEKVAHIVLAANQLDVFEWGVNGFHFNIEGCKGTHTSVRPLIEYMPLKPGRVIFVGNIPKSHWRKDYLEGFFTKLLQGSDGPAETKFVTSIFLLPESCDAYVELHSEMMADSVIFKCTKSPHLLKDIGEDAFICRDPSSVPLMSKHKGGICPERSLFVGISSPGEWFRIDAVRKIFEEILPVISRETNQPGYLEYISVQPGKDYAFFQFNSEAIVDAMMDKYIEHTQIFTSNSNSWSYIILRPPGYVRPGAKYISRGSNYSVAKSKSVFTPGQSKSVDRKKNMAKQGSIHLHPRRFGDEPAKKADCVMSVGASPLPVVSWNGLSSSGALAKHPDCMLVIEGLPKGLSYKLLRGALNELFERSLRGSGLLEVGLLLLRYLDRDGGLDVVASLPSAKFVRVLLSMRKTFTVAGNEVRLLPRSGAKRVNRKGNPPDCFRSQGDLSCLTDDEVNMQREASRYPQCGRPYPSKRRKGHLKGSIYSHPISEHIVKRKRFGLVAAGEQSEEESPRNSNISAQFKKVNKRENKMKLRQRWNGMRARFKPSSSTSLLSSPLVVKQPTKLINVSNHQGQGIGPRVKMSGVRESLVPLRSQCRSVLRVNGNGQKAVEEVPNENLRIVSNGGKRKIQSLDTQPVFGNNGTTSVFGISTKRRRVLQQKSAFNQNKLNIRNQSLFG